MKLQQALDDVRGMIRCINVGESKPKQREFMQLGGFSWDLDSLTSPPNWNLDESKLSRLIWLADSDPYALEAVWLIAKKHLNDGRPLPPPLAKRVIKWIDDLPRGKKKEDPSIRARDELLATLVNYLVKLTGLDVSSRSGKQKTLSDWVSEIYFEETGNLVDPQSVAKAYSRLL